jgi:mono/diheme cytochrome c family protein
MLSHRFVCLLATLACLPAGAARAADTTGRVQFNRDVRPILADKCFACHGPDAAHREADLRFDDEAIAKADRDGSRAIAPGDPGASELIRRITSGDESERMPPAESGKELSESEIDTLRRWIEQGAEYQPHWSYIPPQRPPVPSVSDAAWPTSDIDNFILNRFAAEGLKPSSDADKVTLIRRLYFDLTGLPPAPADVEIFVNDRDPQAYERLVDRLLESPHYGERMAIYWLDLVRYANTVGYHGDQEHAISPYRDWVIKAFNDNMPFDQFTIEQLAGDLLPDATTNQKIASGYNRLLQTSHEGGVQVAEYLKKYDADRVRNLGGVWLGATTGCVECHNHKFDPYTQQDFYSLAAFFADVDDQRTFKGGDTTPTKREPEMVVLSPLVQDEIARLERLASDADASSVRDTSPEDKAAIQKRIDELKQQTQRTMVTESVEPRVIRVLGRGNWMDETGAIVEPAIPAFLGRLETEGRRATRLDLAKWLVSPDQPQTARVFVNRLWYQFFGGGLCRSLDDTGAQGEWPTHPELIDWLAVEFMHPSPATFSRVPAGRATQPWDVKHIVRLIVTSHAYRQSSLVTPELREKDPDNRLFARQGRYRLPAEMIRDNALAVSGLLVDRLGGPTSHPYQPKGYYAPLNFPKRDYRQDDDENQYRRGVYVHWQRQYVHPMLKAFDAPSREECTAQRPISNTPLAALTLLNDPTFVEAARVFAARTMREGGETTEARIRWAWREALSREPADGEMRSLVKLYEQGLAEYRADPQAAEKLLAVGMAPRQEGVDSVELAAWTTVARGVMNLSEFISRN